MNNKAKCTKCSLCLNYCKGYSEQGLSNSLKTIVLLKENNINYESQINTCKKICGTKCLAEEKCIMGIKLNLK